MINIFDHTNGKYKYDWPEYCFKAIILELPSSRRLRPNGQSNLVIALHSLSLLFCNFINTNSLLLGRYESSSPVSCHAPLNRYTKINLSTLSRNCRYPESGWPRFCKFLRFLLRLTNVGTSNSFSNFSFDLSVFPSSSNHLRTFSSFELSSRSTFSIFFRPFLSEIRTLPPFSISFFHKNVPILVENSPNVFCAKIFKLCKLTKTFLVQINKV